MFSFSLLSRAMSVLRTLPDMDLNEMRGMAELMRRALAGTEWDKLKRLVGVSAACIYS